MKLGRSRHPSRHFSSILTSSGVSKHEHSSLSLFLGDELPCFEKVRMYLFISPYVGGMERGFGRSELSLVIWDQRGLEVRRLEGLEELLNGLILAGRDQRRRGGLDSNGTRYFEFFLRQSFIEQKCYSTPVFGRIFGPQMYFRKLIYSTKSEYQRGPAKSSCSDRRSIDLDNIHERHLHQ